MGLGLEKQLAPSLDWAATPLRRKTSEAGPMSTSSTCTRGTTFSLRVRAVRLE